MGAAYIVYPLHRNMNTSDHHKLKTERTHCGAVSNKEKHMRQFIAFIALTLYLLLMGCINTGNIVISVGNSGETTPSAHKQIQDGPAADVGSNAPQASQDTRYLVDVPQGFVYNASSPPQAIITITTDTNQVFTQSFNLMAADSSGFTPAASGTQTFAFAAQDPSAVSSFIQSAVTHAVSTVTIDTTAKATFQGPVDGGSYTIYGRDYHPLVGVENIGSATYTAPTQGGARCSGGHCPIQD